MTCIQECRTCIIRIPHISRICNSWSSWITSISCNRNSKTFISCCYYRYSCRCNVISCSYSSYACTSTSLAICDLDISSCTSWFCKCYCRIIRCLSCYYCCTACIHIPLICQCCSCIYSTSRPSNRCIFILWTIVCIA